MGNPGTEFKRSLTFIKFTAKGTALSSVPKEKLKTWLKLHNINVESTLFGKNFRSNLQF